MESNGTDPKTRWLNHIHKHKSPATVHTYTRHFNKLLEAMKLTPEQFLKDAKADINKKHPH